MSSSYNEDYLPDLLPLYYGRLFPKEMFYQWLSYGDPKKFHNREISFTLLGDIYIRHQSFDTLEEFSQALSKKTPVKIDIGAVYKKSPKSRSPVESLEPTERELVFDIDMTDYDPIRTCCSGADVCTKCWKFMAIACKIIDRALREDFGFKNILWVFSGRRGIHCWVSDPLARLLSDSFRTTVAEYLEIIRGGLTTRKVMISHNIHSCLVKSLEIVDEYFYKYILPEQDILGTPKRLAEFLNNIDVRFRESFMNSMEAVNTSEERWRAFEATFLKLSHEDQFPRNMKFLVEELKLYYTYPRLDVNVSKNLKHLLKAPFCVHPKTGKISVPFNPKMVDNFDVNSVPTVSDLVNEINTYDEKTKKQNTEVESGGVNVKIKDYKKTSLLKPVNVFNEFLRGLKNSNEALKI